MVRASASSSSSGQQPDQPVQWYKLNGILQTDAIIFKFTAPTERREGRKRPLVFEESTHASRKQAGSHREEKVLLTTILGQFRDGVRVSI